MQSTFQPQATDVEPSLADDLLHGAEAIAEFVFGSPAHKRRIYYYVSQSKYRLPIFRIGSVICARRSTLLEWIAQQEGRR